MPSYFNFMNIAFRSAFVWFGFLALAFLNGAFRELVLVQILKIAPLQANQISCVTGVTFWTLLLYLVWKKLNIQNLKQAAGIGAGWFIATAVFETFILNRNLTWDQIRHSYDITAGEYWGLVLLWVGLMPIFGFKLSIKQNS